MGAAAAFLTTFNPAFRSSFTSQLARGRSQWDYGVNKIWQLAHKPHPPTV